MRQSRVDGKRRAEIPNVCRYPGCQCAVRTADQLLVERFLNDLVPVISDQMSTGWKQAINQMAVAYPDRFNKYL